MTSTAFNNSGELLPPTAEELAEVDKDRAILCYAHGIMGDGKPYYAYVAVKPSKYREFKEITDRNGGLLLADYGEIIAGDFLEEPPQSIVDEMREKYGFDEEFVEKVIKRVRDEQGKFMDQKENKRINDVVAMLKKKAPTSGD